MKDFKNKTVLVTGHTGFKGSWLASWLLLLGARVIGCSKDVPSRPSNFEVSRMGERIEDHRIDVRDGRAVRALMEKYEPDFIFHLAAQPLVRRSYHDPIETYETNILGTLNVLEGLRFARRECAAVFITSDKCYENVESVWGYRETDALGGKDPYSASKGAAELLIRSHVNSFFSTDRSNVRIGVCRAGNVIGGGDWASDRIVPDCVRAWATGRAVELRSPHATRPWQHVLEPLSGYLALAAALREQRELHGEPFNFGPTETQNYTVLNLVEGMGLHWDKVRWIDVSKSYDGPYESGLLKLNCDKALHYLKWQATLSFEDTVRFTAQWYRAYDESKSDMASVTRAQIETYTALASKKGIAWAK